MKRLTLIVFSALLLSACANPVLDLKSPCVGGKGSPCDRRAPADQA